MVAAAIFVAATWYAVDGVDIRLSELRWGAVALLLGVGVPVLAVLNGEEFRAMAALLGLRRPFGEGLRVSILGSAANVLPIPGAAIVRMAILRRGGVSYGDASTALLLTAAAWGGSTAVVAGGLAAASGRAPLGLAGVLLGLVTWLVVGVLARLRLGARTSTVLRLIVVEVCSTTVAAIRFLLVIVAVGNEVDLAQAAALTIAGVVAAATGVFPGGLGIREALAGVIGPIVDLAPQLAVLASVGNRIAEYLVLAPAALLLSRGDSSLMDVRLEDADEAEGVEGVDDIAEQSGGAAAAPASDRDEDVRGR